ncbi:oxygenase MpaB family protein [Pyxidicoccus sp. 3LFB2]
MRAGVLSGMVLGLKSLVGGYCSPAGNKPLVFSGRLQEMASRRLAETGRFVQAVCLPDGMRPGHDGWRTSVRVRLMHAQVRHLLSRDPRWKTEEWGTPINQVDMAGTVLLFSLVLAQGLQQLGVALSREEREDLLHLWRYVGRVLGTEEELLPTGEREAEVLWELITTTQAPPDDDSRVLTRALMESPLRDAHTRAERLATERFISITYALGRYLIGDTYADALGFPRSRWRFALPALRALIISGDRVLHGLPGAEGLTLAAGMAYWQRTIQVGLAGVGATFPLPEALRGADSRT